MKKAFAAILLSIYFLVSTGFTVNLHYCMDEFYAWELGESDDECDKCGMTTSKSEGCCRDEVKLLKLKQDVFQAKSATYFFALPALVNATSTYLLLPFKNAVPIQQFAVHDPPSLSGQYSYIKNCVFRI